MPNALELDKLKEHGYVIEARTTDDLRFNGNWDWLELLDFLQDKLPARLWERIDGVARHVQSDGDDDSCPWRLGLQVRTTLTVSSDAFPTGSSLFYAAAHHKTNWRSRSCIVCEQSVSMELT